MSEYSTLSEILHDIAIAGTVPAKMIAQALGRSHVVLLNQLNSNVVPAKLGVDDLIPFMRSSGSVEPLAWLARQMGGVFVKLPAATDMAAGQTAVLESIQEFSEFATAGADAWLDGKIEHHELERIEKEATEAIASIQRFVLLCRGAAGEEKEISLLSGDERSAETTRP